MLNKQDKNNLQNAFQILGLSSNAIRLYILILEKGQLPITQIADELKIARPNIYKLIDELKNKKLIIQSSNSKSSSPIIASPSILLKQLKEEELKYSKINNELSTQLPELLSVYTQGAAPSKIKIFEGREQYIKAFDLIFVESHSLIRFFGSAEDFIIFTNWHGYNKLVKKRVQKKIKLHSLLLPSHEANQMSKKAKEELREVRILKNINPFETSFQLFNKQILFWQPKTPSAVLIEDEYITKMMQSIFEKLWIEAE